MKPATLKKIPTLIRVSLIICVVLFLAATFAAFTAQKLINDIWKQLGMTEKQAREDINESFLTGYLSYYGARNIKNIVAGDRAAIAASILDYTREYLGSPEFEKEYLKARQFERSRIYAPRPVITREDLTKKKIADAEKNAQTFENLLKTTTDANVIKSHKQQLEFWKKAVEDYRSPDSDQINYELLMDANRYKSEQENYDKLMKRWETLFPASPKTFVKQRLANFLAATKDIDYSAALTDRDGKKVFVNPDYEKKNWKWKMCFRAGKEAGETTRAFAEKWVKEL
jgi:hypothetical protein